MSSRVATARRFEPRVLEAVAQLDEREHLAGDVAVLAPAAHLVVVELGVLVPERGRLGVLVHRLLPPQRGDAAEPAGAVDDRDRAPDLARQLARRVALALDRRAALVAPARELLLRAQQCGVRLGQHAHPEQHDEQRRHQRAEREPRHEDVVGARHVQRRRLARRVAPARHRCEIATSVAPAASAPRAISTRLLGVARVRQRERERALVRRTQACGSASAP